MEPQISSSFPRTARLLAAPDFHRVRSKGKKYHSKHFIILVLRKTEGPTRLGLTVSRKVGGAVQRNRVKRLVREFFRQNYGHFGSHLDLSIIAKRGAHALSCADIASQLGFLAGLNTCQGTSNDQADSSSSD